MDAEHIGPQRGAQADRRLKVDEAVEEAAAFARLFRELADADVDQAVEHVGAGRQFKGVDGTLVDGRAGRGLRLGRRGALARAGEREEEEVDSEEKRSRG